MATIPGVNTFAAGSVLTAAQLNTYLSNAVTYFLAPPLAELRQTVAQSVPNFSGSAAVLFDAEDIDSDNGHSTVTNTSRYTSQTTGWYLVGGGIAFAGNATGRRWAYWSVNGTANAGSQVTLAAGDANDIAIPARAKRIFLNSGDYVELIAQQGSGGSLNTYVGSSQAQSNMSIGWVHT